MSLRFIQQQILERQGDPEATGTFFSINGTGERTGHGSHNYPRNTFKYVNRNTEVMPARQASWNAIRESVTSRAAYQPSVRSSLLSRALGGADRAIQSRLSLGGRVVYNANKFAMKGTFKVAGLGYRGANALSKGLLHASIPQIATAGAIVGLGAYMLGSAIGVTSDQAMGAAEMFHESLKEGGRKHYGHSELGQSTQGLVFGLNSRRTA